MAWETTLDRLVLQQIHLAEKGEARVETVRQQVLDLWHLAGPRPASAFQLGYAKVLLGLDLGPEPDGNLRRWHLFGSLRAHDRRGERNWIAERLEDPQVLVELLTEPNLAAQVLPLLVRTLFWCGDLKLALRAIEYLAAEASAPELALVVDAAITDLLARLETRVEAEDEESTASILRKVLAVEGFDRLPADVRARYHKALAERLLATSDWEQARAEADTAAELAAAAPRLRSAAWTIAALAVLRVHSIEQLEPRSARPERDEALELLHHVEEDLDQAAPPAVFVRSILAYETGSYATAARGLEKAIAGMRRTDGRDQELLDRARFFQAASLLAEGRPEENSRALKLMDKALDTVRPDLESFYAVHEALKKLDRKLALRFLDHVDVGRGSSPDQLLFVALEYLGLGEASQALAAGSRVLEVAVDLDQRIDAMRAMLTAHNMKGEREQARACFAEMRELLLQRGAFEQLEKLLKSEDFVGQALDHVEIKIELAGLYEEMEGRDFERAQLQVAIARSLRARKEVESLRQAHGLLQEVACHYPELANDDLQVLEKLLELNSAEPPSSDAGAQASQAVAKRLGHAPRVLVVGGNERQRRHHPKFEELAERWGLTGEWLMTNYTSPQKVVGAIGDRLRSGIDVLLLLHWNRHETTEPALELARKASVPARTVHYAGFTSLQVALAEMLEKMAQGKGSKAAV
ncbi:MAG: hypothetical protein AB7O97_20600 [Planctomycetota bacterium]